MIFSAIFGIAHFVLVGIPFLQSNGGGESVAYQVFFLDFPLYILAETLFQRLLLNSVLFNFLWFVVLGTAMYALLGYIVGVLIVCGFRKSNAET